MSSADTGGRPAARAARLVPYGPDAVLVDLDGLAEVDAVRAALHAAHLDGVVDVVPAARTVLVTASPRRPRNPDTVLAAVGDVVAGVDLTGAAGPRRDGLERPEPVELGVHYDGEDLAEVAETAGLPVDKVVGLHTGAEYTVAFGGFAPGFAYLAGLPGPLQQPRLDRPRTRIPAGSVGVAGEFSGVYPRPSPGGWRLLGRLAGDAPVLFDPDRDPPALLTAGTPVRFRDAGRFRDTGRGSGRA